MTNKGAKRIIPHLLQAQEAPICLQIVQHMLRAIAILVSQFESMVPVKGIVLFNLIFWVILFSIHIFFKM